jgi:O-methyltransferase
MNLTLSTGSIVSTGIRGLLRRGIRPILRRYGYDLTRVSDRSDLPPDFDEDTIQVCRDVREFTKTSMERIFTLCRAVEYVVQHDIPGDIVECGVWRGGSMMAVARTLLRLGAADRHLYLFDTFDGMPEPTEHDRDFRGTAAADLLGESDKNVKSTWSYSPLDEVQRNMRGTGYDESRVHFVRGKVEDTIPANAPDTISLLRLDTDWYESTYHELVHLYPRVSAGGALIIDDYGHWQGARRAVDQYVEEHRLKLFLSRIDYTARICIKPVDESAVLIAGRH